MVAPVANTITSTTSATQDLEVFKNYPSEKNNKLIQQKYGSEDEFFQKVQEEGYKEGFESVPKPSFDPNLPMTEIGDDTYQKYMGQFLQNQAKINPIPQETFGLEESVKGLPTQKPIPMTEDYATTWNQRLNVPDLTAAGEASQALYNQGALPDVKMTTDTAVDQPSPVPKGDVRKFIESIEQKILTEDDSWSILKMLKNLRSMKQNIKGGITTVKEAVEPTVNELKDEVFQLEQKYQTSLQEKIIPTLEKWGKNIKNVTGKVVEGIKESDLDQSERVKKFGVDYKEKIASHNKRLKAVGMKPVIVPLVFSGFGEEPLDRRARELQKREKLMMEAGKAGADPEFELDKYISGKREKKIKEKTKTKDMTEFEELQYELEKKGFTFDEKEKKKVKEKDKDVIQEVIEEKIAPQADVRRDEEQDAINQLMKDAETKEGLKVKDQKALKTGLEGEGVKTAGLTDTNMLLISMGLGIMASDKPGLQGLGSGALEGFKVVAPLMKEKSSDIQMITVKNDEGENVIVRYNKRKGTYEETGLMSGTTSVNPTLQKIQALSDKANIPEDVVATAIVTGLTETKGKSRAARIEGMVKILSLRLPNISVDDKSLIEAATNIIDDMEEGKVNFKESDVGL